MADTQTNISKNCIQILQWNARSIVAQKASLQHFLINHDVDIIVISETWLKESQVFSLSGYNCIKKCRTNGTGGVAIFIKQAIEFQEFKILQNFNSSIEACAVTLNHLKYNIVSIYKPPDVCATLGDWESLFNQFKAPTIFCGDFNAHHGLWGYSYDNSQGNILVEATEIKSLVILNNGNPTRISVPSNVNQFSAVDLTLVSSEIADITEWEVLPDSMGSDHFPILLTILNNNQSFEISPYCRWNDACGNWDKFQDSLNKSLNDIANLNDLPNQEKFTNLLNAITVAADSSMPIKKPFTPTSVKPIWWDENCTRAYETRRQALLNYRQQGGCVNFGHSCYGGMGKRASTGVEDTPAALGEEVRYLPQSGDPALVFTGPRGSVYKPDSATKELARQQQVENVSKVIRQWIQNYRRAQELSNDLV
ncbi:unnamed protein product [Callosobruchus maculatus]|uniref:Endonuclease/exonuclease/phosphatase domain-containing protein n=1 Tax=Callosobruchus maculatus TaxID=64391 RepID=A0A653DP07_CALMS|nr:unnamed protein product [Callosobruchus maculatus]